MEKTFLGYEFGRHERAHIGRNVIFGTGSVVHGNISDDLVLAENPARVLCAQEEYLEKRRQRTLAESLLMARSDIERYGKRQTKYDMRHFKDLFGGKAKSQ